MKDKVYILVQIDLERGIELLQGLNIFSFFPLKRWKLGISFS